MNKKTLRVIGTLAAFAMAIGAGVCAATHFSRYESISVNAASANTTLTADDFGGNGKWTGSQAAQTATAGGFTLSSTSGMYASGDHHLRQYSGATLTLSSSIGNMKSVVFTCTANGTANYGPGKMSGDGYVASSGKTGTWTGDSASFQLTGGQSRITSIEITYDSNVVVSGVSISGTTEVSSGTKRLAQTQLTGTVSYSSGSGTQGLSWESSVPSVAVVNNSGLVTFLDNGSSVIKATSTEDNTKFASVTVTASNLADAKGTIDNPFLPSEIGAFIDNGYDGESTLYLKGIVSSKGTWNDQYKNGEFDLSDNGNADSPDSVKIYRYSASEAYFNNLAVGDYVLVSGVWVNYGGIYETTKDNSAFDPETISKVASVSASATNASFPKGTVLSTSDFNVNATYANGYVANGVNGFAFTVNGEEGGALNVGNNAIVISYCGQTANLNITGEVIHATSVSVEAEATVYVGFTKQLTATVLPAEQSDPLVWASSDEEKATVSDEGLVSGFEAGSVTITVFADTDEDGVKDDGEPSASCSLTVSERVATALSITGKKTSFSAGDTFTVNGTISVTFEDDPEHPVNVEQTNPNMVYYIGSQSEVNARTAPTIAIGDTLTGLHDGLYVKAFYGSIGASAYTISVSAPFDYSEGAFYKVTENLADWTGHFILVFESSELAFHGKDEAKASTPVTIDNNDRIVPVENLAVLEIAAMQGGYSIKVKNGSLIDKYLGATSDANGLNGNANPVANAISLANGGVDISSSNAHLRFNAADDQMRFRFFKSSSYGSQSAIQIYQYRSNVSMVEAFVNDYMHLSDGQFDTTEYVGLCDNGGVNSPYNKAKAAFNGLTEAQRQLFVDQGGEGELYEAAYNRLVAWAAANGESIGTDGSGNPNVIRAARVDNGITSTLKSVDSTVSVILTVLGVGVLIAGGLLLVQRKGRKNN